MNISNVTKTISNLITNYLFAYKRKNMRILLTGASGYIGKRLLVNLIEEGHEVIACVREPRRFHIPEEYKDKVTIFKVDFSQPVDLTTAPLNFDAAYYLIHSLSTGIGNFTEKEANMAQIFVDYLDQSSAKQVVYLTGIVNTSDELSVHLSSRLNVEKILGNGQVSLTALRAGIIIGSGSASFELIRDLVEKLPVMVAPKWLNTLCQPIGIRNVLQFLTSVLGKEKYYNKHYDIGCDDILTYKEMLLQYAEVRNLKRWIYTVPVMTPRLSSYWLFFITSTSYNLAVNLVNSMKVDVVCKPNNLAEDFGIELFDYKTSVAMAFSIIEKNTIISSWKDSFSSSLPVGSLEEFTVLPEHGTFTDYREKVIDPADRERIVENIWSIGGETGWYYANWLWKIRGYLDKIVGGIGLRRGRTHPTYLEIGDAVDFWRVLDADRSKGYLLLFAEMKLPGEAWLEFQVKEEEGVTKVSQRAVFFPHGISGRLYWYSVVPLHYFIFQGMLDNLVVAGE